LTTATPACGIDICGRGLTSLAPCISARSGNCAARWTLICSGLTWDTEA
jgi:hypothetical protein